MERTDPRYRLPERWSAPEEVEDVLLLDGMTLYRAGVSSVGADGDEVCGSAAETGGPALARAWFELLERVSSIEAIEAEVASYDLKSIAERPFARWARADVFPITEAADRWRYARSNGIALHVDWRSACERALWELAERDRVLRAWHGEFTPVPLTIDLPAGGLLPASYDWRAYRFPEEDDESFSRAIEVVGVFGFPTLDRQPFAIGFAARPEREDALRAAARESLQMLAFLWGEPPPSEEALDARPSAMQHLDTYQVAGAHERVRRWLQGSHLPYRVERAAHREPVVGFVDLTPSWLSELRVAKAVCRAATPLIFGDSPLAAHLPAALRRHPIP